MTTAKQRLDSMSSEYRADYLQGGGKAGIKDKLTSQRVGVRRFTMPLERQELYAQNQFLQNIIDIPAEDLTRNWIDLEMDEDIKEKILAKMVLLNCKENFTDMRRYERLHGDGFISIGVTQRSPFTLAQPLREDQIKSVDYLNAFSSMKVGSFLMNDDVFSIRYGKVDQFQLNRMSSIASSLTEGTQFSSNDNLVHHTRLFHDQTRRLEGELQGQSIIEPMWDTFAAFDTAQWSVAQMLYDFTFKVYSSNGINALTPAERREFSMLADFQFRTEALAIIGNEEELKKVGTAVSGVDQLLDFIWETLSGAAKMPKSVIKGQEAGTISGAQYDVLNYYSRISAAQETELRPHIERLIRYLLIGEGYDPDKVPWKLKFNPLWNVDQETDAKIRKMDAESDEIYMQNGVVTAEEIKEQRYPNLLPTESNLTKDAEDFTPEELHELIKRYEGK